jgi:hypothetical protein
MEVDSDNELLDKLAAGESIEKYIPFPFQSSLCILKAIDNDQKTA